MRDRLKQAIHYFSSFIYFQVSTGENTEAVEALKKKLQETEEEKDKITKKLLKDLEEATQHSKKIREVEEEKEKVTKKLASELEEVTRISKKFEEEGKLKVEKQAKEIQTLKASLESRV